MKNKKSDTILRELKHHLPFTLAASFVAGVLVAIFYLVGRVPSEELFEIMHPAHVLVSAVATSAIYWKYKRSVWQSVLVGTSGAILIGSLSDVLLPFLAGNLFSLHTHFHLPILEEPVLILGVAFFGAILGMRSNLFRVSHISHVFLSVFASLFYLLAFSIEVSAIAVLLISVLVFLVVYIPCCVSDIVFPLFFIKKPCGDCGHWHEKNY
jgi:hypothetical protein